MRGGVGSTRPCCILEPMSIRFAHTNLVARDWRRLARFYWDVFACSPVGAERALSGSWLDEAVAIPGAHIHGLHLRLPGHGETGPTLEIFEYAPSRTSEPPTANRPGFGHVAFEVDDVAIIVDCAIEHGGARLGKTVTRAIEDAGTITFAYLRDPEGNIVEIQQWATA